MSKPAELSFFPLAVMIARNQAAPIIANASAKKVKEIDYEGRKLNYEAFIDGKREAEAIDRNKEP